MTIFNLCMFLALSLFLAYLVFHFDCLLKIILKLCSFPLLTMFGFISQSAVAYSWFWDCLCVFPSVGPHPYRGLI